MYVLKPYHSLVQQIYNKNTTKSNLAHTVLYSFPVISDMIGDNTLQKQYAGNPTYCISTN